jgi:hypothetical protein
MVMGFSLYALGSYIYTRNVKIKALDIARSLVINKGIVNLGAGYWHNELAKDICELPEVACNVDFIGDAPKLIRANLEDARLPFYDNQFDVAFASHILEHLNNWQDALTEWSRIADNVVLVLPKPWTLGNLTERDHKTYFLSSGVDFIEFKWNKVQVFI